MCTNYTNGLTVRLDLVTLATIMLYKLKKMIENYRQLVKVAYASL